MDRLVALAEGVGRDPAQTAADAASIAESAREAEDWATVARAQAIRGRALRMLGEIGLAEHTLRDAAAAGDRHGDPDLAADAHLALAGVLSSGGRHDDAFAALEEVARIGSAPVRARALLQRAAICRDVGAYDEALALFAEAVPGLRHDGRDLDLARVQANRGAIMVDQGRIDEATAVYEDAIALFRSVDQEFVALQVTHDLGCAVAHLGDLPRALRLFDEAADGMIALGNDDSIVVLSRAEALLRAGLSADALVHARDAARRLDAERNGFGAAQALLAVAEACRLEGEPATAIQAAERAAVVFAAGGATGWERAAAIEAARTRLAQRSADRADADRLVQIADQLAVSGDLRSEVDARCLAAVGAAELQDHQMAAEQLARATALVRRSRLAGLQASLQHATGATRLAAGDLPGARRSLRAAFTAVETATQLFGGGDASAALGTDGRSIAELAMRVASVERSTMRTLAWMEQVRASAHHTAVLPPDDESATAFASLRAITGELRRAERDGEPTDDLRRRQAALESSMRTTWLRSARASSTPRSPTFDPGALRAAVDGTAGDVTVVSIGLSDDEAFAVVIERRRARSVPLGDRSQLLAIAERAAGTLRGIAASSGAAAVLTARRRAFEAAAADLDRAVLAPLRLRSAHVVLVLPAALHALPWAATPTLASRPFSIAPSVAWWVSAVTAPAPVPARALVVAGPRLEGALAEARGVAACYRRATMLTDDAATVAATVAAMGDHDLAHVVAHGRFRHDNPLWSTIELADGAMSVYELQRLRRVPSTVVVATCESAISGGRAGAQLHGLASTLLQLGARTIIAAVGALPDDECTRDTMIGVHRDIQAGIGAADSLARRRAASLRASDGAPDVVDVATSATLVTLGVGTA